MNIRFALLQFGKYLWLLQYYFCTKSTFSNPLIFQSSDKVGILDVTSSCEDTFTIRIKLKAIYLSNTNLEDESFWTTPSMHIDANISCFGNNYTRWIFSSSIKYSSSQPLPKIPALDKRSLSRSWNRQSLSMHGKGLLT